MAPRPENYNFCAPSNILIFRKNKVFVYIDCMTLAKFRSVAVVAFCGLFALSAFAQKGIDTQTEKIKAEGDKELSRQNDATKSLNWGKGKTKTPGRLANPYQFA